MTQTLIHEARLVAGQLPPQQIPELARQFQAGTEPRDLQALRALQPLLAHRPVARDFGPGDRLAARASARQIGGELKRILTEDPGLAWAWAARALGRELLDSSDVQVVRAALHLELQRLRALAIHSPDPGILGMRPSERSALMPLPLESARQLIASWLVAQDYLKGLTPGASQAAKHLPETELGQTLMRATRISLGSLSLAIGREVRLLREKSGQETGAGQTGAGQTGAGQARAGLPGAELPTADPEPAETHKVRGLSEAQRNGSELLG